MKKTVFLKSIAAIAIAMMTIVSCKDSKDEEGAKLTADEQKSKIDETGVALINQIETDKWSKTAELVKPLVKSMESIDAEDQIASAVSETYTYDAVKRYREEHSIMDLGAVKGHYTVDENNKLVPVEGEFDDFKVFITADEHDYEIVFDADMSETLITVTDREYNDTGYFDQETDTWINVSEGCTIHELSQAYLPEKIVAKVVADKTVPFSFVFDLSYTGPTDLTKKSPDPKVLDISQIVIVSSISLIFDDYTFKVDKFNISESSASEKFTIKRGKKTLIQLDADLKDMQVVKTDSGSDISFGEVNVFLDVLGDIQVKGFLDYRSIMNTMMVAEEAETAEQMNKQLDLIKDYYSLKLYYDGTSTVQAWVEFQALEEAEGEVNVIYVICFADGTSYRVEEFFTPENFSGALEAFNTFSEKFNTVMGDLLGGSEDKVEGEDLNGDGVIDSISKPLS